MPVTINGTTGIAGVDGSAATPAVQGSDNNTGIFYPAADTIAFGEGGAEVMRINSSGNVGIGTTTPGGKLDVAGTSASAFGMRATQTDTSAYVSLGFDNSSNNSQIISSGNGYFRIFTNNTERMRIDASGYMQGTVNGLSAGRIPAMQFFRLNSDLAGANVNTAQSVFGVGVTLVGSTQYAFEAIYPLSKTAGTTSHTVGLGFGGTATINNIGYLVGAELATNTGTTIPTSATAYNLYVSTASNTTVTNAETNATRAYEFVIRGTVSINAGGTFIPQYTLSAAPGGAYSTVAGSYFAIWPIAASGSNVSIGTWA